VSLARIVREKVSRRFLPEGGITHLPCGRFGTGATAWGILVYRAAGGEQEILEKHCARLIREQDKGGRLCVDKEHPDSYWPTAIAILAWQDSQRSDDARQKAVQFLLKATGVHSPRLANDPSGHDTSLKGWPWVAGTHSWIEPTALAVIALKATGHLQHDRVREGIRMMLDRQLPHGGWNYGNSVVFGRELRPMPESTGAALTGLAGQVEVEVVARSLDYLQGEVSGLRTPVSLGWALLGLAAWDMWPSNGFKLVERCLTNQSRYGEYDTSSFCLLLLGALAGDFKTMANGFSFSDINPSTTHIR
jgi:hypothetical protein